MWAIISSFWSDTPVTTVNALVSLVTLLMIGLLASVRLQLHELARVLLLSGFIMGLASVASVVLVPNYAVHQFSDAAQAVHAGAWRGVFSHKNHLGQTAAMYAAIALTSGPRVLRSAIARFAIVALMIFLLLMSGSASAIVIVVLAPAFVFFLIRLERAIQIMVGMALVMAGMIGYFVLEALLDALGRDLTFTGRTYIWKIALYSISESPILGYGYMSSLYGDFVSLVRRQIGVGDPHNAFLDIALGLGLIGVGLFLAAVISALVSARRLSLGGEQRYEGACVLTATIAAWLIAGMSEAAARPLTSMGCLGFLAVAGLSYGNLQDFRSKKEHHAEPRKARTVFSA